MTTGKCDVKGRSRSLPILKGPELQLPQMMLEQNLVLEQVRRGLEQDLVHMLVLVTVEALKFLANGLPVAYSKSTL